MIALWHSTLKLGLFYGAHFLDLLRAVYCTVSLMSSQEHFVSSAYIVSNLFVSIKNLALECWHIIVVA
jgi:hypothetical protein